MHTMYTKARSSPSNRQHRPRTESDTTMVVTTNRETVSYVVQTCLTPRDVVYEKRRSGKSSHLWASKAGRPAPISFSSRCNFHSQRPHANRVRPSNNRMRHKNRLTSLGSIAPEMTCLHRCRNHPNVVSKFMRHVAAEHVTGNVTR